MSVTQPLGLLKHLRKPSQGLEVVPLFNVLLIALMLTLLGSRFIFAPGVSVELPRASADSPAVSVVPTMAVLTLLKDNSLIYGGRLLSVDNFEREAAASLLPQRPAADETAAGDPAATQPRILLIKSDTGVSVGTVLRVMNAARLAGYDQVQIAEQLSREDIGPAGTLRR